MNFLFGETIPVPLANLRVLHGGETLSLANRTLQVLYTPGHASHHVSYFDSSDGTAFVGDTTGFHISGQPYIAVLAPPPDINLEAWDTSLAAIAALQPKRLFLTHFGYAENPAAHLAEHREALHRWAALVAEILRAQLDENGALEAFVAATTAEIRQRLSPADAEHCLFNVGLSLSWLGLARYHRKRAAARA